MTPTSPWPLTRSGTRSAAGPMLHSTPGSLPSVTLRGPPSRLMHEEAAVDAQGLSRHVARLARDEKADHVGDVLGALHPPERHRAGALAGELFRRHPHQLALIARDRGPHVSLHEARADAVHPD